MKPMNKLAEALKWEQPSAAKMEWFLHAGEDTVATLKFRTAFGTLATVETAEGNWTFKRSGFWNPKATVRVAGTETDLATVTPSSWTGRGEMVLADGRRFKVAPNVWRNTFELQSADDRPIVQFDVGGFFRLSAKVTMQSDSADLEATPWLVPFAWYLYVMYYMDAIATSASLTGA